MFLSCRLWFVAKVIVNRMRPNTIRVKDAVLTLCCGSCSSSTAADATDQLLRQSSERWWNVVNVMGRLLGTRQLLSVLMEAGAFWSHGDAYVVKSSPVTRPAPQAALNAAGGEGEASTKQRGGRAPKSTSAAGGPSTASSADINKPTLSKQPSRYDHLLLDDAADTAAAQSALDAWRAAVSDAMPAECSRQYVASCLLKLCGFFDRHTNALQEYSLANKQDAMTASLSSTQGLSISQELDAPLRELEATADRMFPFRSGREVFFELLKHANMAHALVVCTMIDDAMVEEASSSGPKGAPTRKCSSCVLGPPCSFYLLDFLALRHGARLDVSHVELPPPTTSSVVDAWRAPVKSQSVRVVGDGVTINGGKLGVVAVPLDGIAQGGLPSSSSAAFDVKNPRSRFIPLEREHVRVLAFSAADALLAGGSRTADASEDASLAATFARKKRRKQPLSGARTTVTPTAVNVDLEDIRDRVVRQDRGGLDERGLAGGILARDMLEPRRRVTRFASTILAHQQLEAAQQQHQRPPMASSSSDDDDVTIQGVANTANKPNDYEVDANRAKGETQLSTLRVMMSFAVRVAAELQKHNTTAVGDVVDCEQGDADANVVVPLHIRVALVALLVLHTLPTARFAEVTRLASPEIAWFVVERLLQSEKLYASEVGMVTAGYALALVEPVAMALPLWYSLLVGLYHRRILWRAAALPTPAVVKREPSLLAATPSHELPSTSAGFAALWGLWQTHVMRHPLLPSVFHCSVWSLLERHGVDSAALGSGAAAATGVGGKGAEPRRKVALKGTCTTPSFLLASLTEPAAISPASSTAYPPRSPTASEASVVELEPSYRTGPQTRRLAQQQRRGDSDDNVIMEEAASGQLMQLHRKRSRNVTTEPPAAQRGGRGGRWPRGGPVASSLSEDVLASQGDNIFKIDVDEEDAKGSGALQVPVKGEPVDEADDSVNHHVDGGTEAPLSWVSRCHMLWVQLAASAATPCTSPYNEGTSHTLNDM